MVNRPRWFLSGHAHVAGLKETKAASRLSRPERRKSTLARKANSVTLDDLKPIATTRRRSARAKCDAIARRIN